MSETVKRFVFHSDRPESREASDGNWVSWTDYQRLEASLFRHRNAWSEQELRINTLTDQLRERTKQRDAWRAWAEHLETCAVCADKTDGIGCHVMGGDLLRAAALSALSALPARTDPSEGE
jgi:hypothetical protein